MTRIPLRRGMVSGFEATGFIGIGIGFGIGFDFDECRSGSIPIPIPIPTPELAKSGCVSTGIVMLSAHQMPAKPICDNNYSCCEAHPMLV